MSDGIRGRLEPAGRAAEPGEYSPTSRPATPRQWQYVGAFRLPAGEIGESRFGFGGHALAFRKPTSQDSAGSLFLVGNPLEHRVAEIAVPTPSPAREISRLPVAKLLQPFADVTAGLAFTVATEPRIGGLHVSERRGEERLHWTVYKWYNVDGEDIPGHGVSWLELNRPNPQGLWRLKGIHNQRSAGYLFEAPAQWARDHLGGRRLISGLNINQGVATSSSGPALFAFSAATEGPAQGALTPIPLVYYPDDERRLPGHKNPDSWRGATWIRSRSGDAVVTAGRVSMGPERYGLPEPEDCSQYAGYHGDPYQPRLALYDPEHLEAAARGETPPWEVLPYLVWDPSEHLFPTCEWYLTGLSFDEDTGRLFLLQPAADTVSNEWEPQPIVYVFSIPQ